MARFQDGQRVTHGRFKNNMEYKVLSIKWRPQRFEDVVGQKHITQTLINSISRNRIAQGYIFSGPRGVGKTTMARLMAMSLNAENGPTANYDPVSNISLEISGGRSIDVLEIDGASNRGIEEIRNLREQIKFAPMNCTYRVIIIDEVHMLTNQAFNALLRTLEEPPSHAKFIFCTTDVHKIPPTIISRCQRFDFNRISSADIVKHLSLVLEKEKIIFDSESIALISRKADGSMRDALSLLDQVIAFCGEKIEYKSVMDALGLVNSDLFFDFSTSILEKNENILVNTIAKFLEFGVPASEVLNGISQHIRNLLYAGMESGDLLLDLNEENKLRYKEEAKKWNRMDLLRTGQILSDVSKTIRKAHDPFLVLEMTAFKLIEMDSVITIEEILSKVKDESISGNNVNKSIDDQNDSFSKEVTNNTTPDNVVNNKKEDKKDTPGDNLVKPQQAPLELEKTSKKVSGNLKNETELVKDIENIENHEPQLERDEDNILDPRPKIENDKKNKSFSLSFDSMIKIWKETLEAVNNEKPSLGTVLEDYYPKAFSNNILKIEAIDYSDFNSKIANRGIPYLEKKISDKIKKNIKIKFTKNQNGDDKLIKKEKSKPVNFKNDKEILDQVVDLFDGEILR